MHPAIQIPILTSLLLIWLSQLIFAPMILSIVLLMMIGVLYRHFKLGTKGISSLQLKIAKISLVLIGLGSIYFSYGTFIGVEAGTAALAIFLFAKALELKSKRDLIIFFNFALFVSASLFLYSQSIWMALLVLMCLVSCLFGLYRIQTTAFALSHTQSRNTIQADVKHVLKCVMLAVPFFVVLFLFFPRLPPLWHVPIASDQGVTGISDRMSPGSIAELSQSSALAFRILIDLNQLPQQSELYWRGMVLDQYDGTTWTSHPSNQYPLQIQHQNLEHYGIRYQYLGADPRQKWITGLEKSVPLQRRFSLHQDLSITPHRLVQRNQPIELVWVGESLKMDQFNALAAQLYTQFPKDKDLKAQQFAQQLFEQSQREPQRYVKSLIQWYQLQQFKYSLQPGRLGEHRVDEFLFQSKTGFCEHYASSFVLLMRYVGIPARVVVGYQGGQAAPDAQSWEVRQLDAHAWTEVFINGTWQRIDPTAEIAPQRINLGMQQFLSQDRAVLGAEGLSPFKYQQFALLNKIRIWSDYASYQWQDKVIGFNRDDQKKWMNNLGLNSTVSIVVSMVTILITLLLLYLMVEKYKARGQADRIQVIINRMSNQLDQHDQIQAYETFRTWINRLDMKYDLDVASELIELHHQMVYLNKGQPENYQKFEKLIKAYSNRLKVNKKACQTFQK